MKDIAAKEEKALDVAAGPNYGFYNGTNTALVDSLKWNQNAFGEDLICSTQENAFSDLSPAHSRILNNSNTWLSDQVFKNSLLIIFQFW